MESHSSDLVPLLTVLGAAFLVPMALNRLKVGTVLPVVVGEILAGILLGRSGLGIVRHGAPILDILSTLGFIFLMFLSGLEISFSGMLAPPPDGGRSAARRRLGNPLALGLISFTGTLALSLATAMLLVALGWVTDPWIMALILSTTSLGLVVPVLKEYDSRSSSSPWGRT